MSEATNQLIPTLLALPVRERLEVMDALIASLPHPASPFIEGTPDFDAELDRRRAEHESGADPGVLAEDFFRERTT
jgi:putative addiction module component (TIGR02574 family)